MRRVVSVFGVPASAFASCALAFGLMAAAPASAGNYIERAYPTVIYPGPSFSYSYTVREPRRVYVDDGYRHERYRDYRYDDGPRYHQPRKYHGYRRPGSYGHGHYGWSGHGAVHGGALLQTGSYPKCRTAYIPYAWTWYRGRDYRC